MLEAGRGDDGSASHAKKPPNSGDRRMDEGGAAGGIGNPICRPITAGRGRGDQRHRLDHHASPDRGGIKVGFLASPVSLLSRSCSASPGCSTSWRRQVGAGAVWLTDPFVR